MDAISKGHFTLRTMYDQLASLQKLGPVSLNFSLFGRGPSFVFDPTTAKTQLSFCRKKIEKTKTDDPAPGDAPRDGPVRHARPGPGQGDAAADEVVHDDDGLDDGQGELGVFFFSFSSLFLHEQKQKQRFRPFLLHFSHHTTTTKITTTAT